MTVTSQVQPPSRASRLESIQLLRAIAATMVVILHASIVVYPEGGLPFIPRFGVGVDLFFVISGFVIVYSARSLFEKPGGWRRFLLLRIIRVVPLYWMALTLRLAMLAAGALAGVKAFPDAVDILTSYFFIPHDSMGYGDAYPFPILDLGWSLNFEMFFYLVFACFLALPMRRAVFACGLVMALGVGLALVFPLPLPFGFWLQPIILEFVSGMALALIYMSGVRISPWVSVLLIAAGLYIWFGSTFSQYASGDGPGYYAFSRFIVLGGGAICLMAAATLTRDLDLPKPLLSLSTLGDSSYALYLLHPFVLLAFKAVHKYLPTVATLQPLILAAMVLATIGCAHAFHILIERRINAKLRDLTAVHKSSVAMKQS